MKNIWFIFCFIFTQLNSQIHLVDISTLDALKVDLNTTIAPEFIEERSITLVDVDGVPFFSRIKSNNSNEEKIWLRRKSDTSIIWNVYAIKKVEGRYKRDLQMVFHKTELDENTYKKELMYEDDQIYREVKKINSNTSFILPDSIYMVKNKEVEINETTFYKLLPSGDTTVTQQFKITNNQTDHMNNWSQQTKSVRRLLQNNPSVEYDIQSNRKIYYQDSFMHEQYYEIIPSLLEVNDQKMTWEDNKEAFEERKKAVLEATGGSIGYDIQYQIIDQYFNKRYFNSEYFFEIELPDIYEKEILKTRLFTDIPIKVLGLHNQEFYSGRLHYDRHWYDQTRSFQQMKTSLSEKMEEIIKTGKTKEVNGYKCDEYKMLINSKERYYYVTEELPFIDYFMSAYRFPGFVLRIEEFLDEVGQVMFECDVKKVNYPAHYLEFTKKGQEKLGIRFKYLSLLHKM